MKDYSNESLFSMCVQHLKSVLDVHGEVYHLSCVEAEEDAFYFTKNVKDFIDAIRLPVVSAVNIVSGELKDVLLSDYVRKSTVNTLKRSLCMLLHLL